MLRTTENMAVSWKNLSICILLICPQAAVVLINLTHPHLHYFVLQRMVAESFSHVTTMGCPSPPTVVKICTLLLTKEGVYSHKANSTNLCDAEAELRVRFADTVSGLESVIARTFAPNYRSPKGLLDLKSTWPVARR